MRKALIGLAALVLPIAGGWACAGEKPSGRNAPNLAACRNIKPVEGTEIERSGPIPVPAAWSGIVRSDRTHFAVSTMGGRTLCIDTSWMEGIADPEVSLDGRFVQFDWFGYESGGHIVADRSGRGVEFDTGDKPVPSPSGARMAAVQYSEAGFGSLEGFGVWDIAATPMTELARIVVPEGLTEWRMERWHGNACVQISAIRFEELPSDQSELPVARRQPWVAIETGGTWRIAPAGKEACPGP